MRISDWSSDVCSSDLRVRAARGFVEHGLEHGLAGAIDRRLAFRDRTCVGEVAGRRVQPHELRRHRSAVNVEYRKARQGYYPFIARTPGLLRPFSKERFVCYWTQYSPGQNSVV